ncbi:MAG: hypothetical protein JWL76_922 [Thermoleophilia bacterium]|nr:hypothetical protein [Thermoleophilia bacterium]
MPSGNRSISWCLRAALALVTFLVATALTGPAPANAEEPQFNPVGAQRALVVLFEKQVVRADECSDFDVLKLHTAPRNTAAEWQAIINADRFYPRATYGMTSLQVRVLANPASRNGWWKTPHTNVEYCRNAQLREKTDRLGNFYGDAAIVQDAAETIIPRAIAAGVITKAEVATYHRLIVIDNYHGHGGQARGSVTYKAGGSTARKFSAHVQGEHWSNKRALQVMEHEFGHQLGLQDYYGSCESFAGTKDPECTGPWDPMGVAEWDSFFNAYSRIRAGWIGTAEANANTLEPLNEEPFANSTSPYSRTVTIGPLADPTATNRVLRIPRTSGEGYDGWVVECRRKYLGDVPLLPAGGVVIYRIDERLQNPRHLTERPTVRRDVPSNAALQPGERWQGMYSLFGAVPNLQVRFDADVPRSSIITRVGGIKKVIDRPPGCRVTVSRPTVEYQVVGTSVRTPKATVGAETFVAPSPDVWVDSPMNGLGETAEAPVQVRTARPASGTARVALPVGDPPWVGRENLVRFRVRNSGTTTLTDVRVSVDAIQIGPGGGCRERERITIGDHVIPSIAAGATALGSVPWVPPVRASGSWSVRIHVPQVAGEEDAEDNIATTTTLPSVGGATAAGSLVTDLPDGASCTAGADDPAVLDVPRGWRVSLSGARVRPAPGSALTRVTRLTVVPPRGSRPGATARIVLGYRSDTASPAQAPTGAWRLQPPFLQDRDGEPLNAFVVLVGLRGSATIGTSCGGGTAMSASSLVTGQLLPVHADVPITVEYVGPNGRTVHATTKSSSDGSFASSVALPVAGGWTAQAWWQGDRDTLPAQSTTCSISIAEPPPAPPAPRGTTTISFSCPSQAMAPGIPISGSIAPAHAGAAVAVTWTSPQQQGSIVRSMTTDANGQYGETFAPPFSGQWTGQASWAGDADHFGATSTPCATAYTVLQ